jgi:cyclase
MLYTSSRTIPSSSSVCAAQRPVNGGRYEERKVALKVRIIPCLDVDAGRVVKGMRFMNLRDAGDPVELAAFYDTEGADEIVFYDITASYEHRETAVALARRAAEEVFVPYTIGGGVKSVVDMRAMLRAGADKVSINSAAVRNPDLISEGAERFGSQCVVLSVDVRRKGTGSGWEVYLDGGRLNTEMDAISWLAEAERRGAGELVLNSIDADGTETGYDLDLISAVAEKTGLPLVASGGAGSPEHMVAAIGAGAGAVLAASIFHFGEWSVAGVKEHLRGAGVPVR